MNRLRRPLWLVCVGVILVLGGLILPTFCTAGGTRVPLTLIPAMLAGADPTQFDIRQFALALLCLTLLVLALITAFLLARVGWADLLPQEPVVGHVLFLAFGAAVSLTWVLVLFGHGLARGAGDLPPGLVALTAGAVVALFTARHRPTHSQLPQ